MALTSRTTSLPFLLDLVPDPAVCFKSSPNTLAHNSMPIGEKVKLMNKNENPNILNICCWKCNCDSQSDRFVRIYSFVERFVFVLRFRHDEKINECPVDKIQKFYNAQKRLMKCTAIDFCNFPDPNNNNE